MVSSGLEAEVDGNFGRDAHVPEHRAPGAAMAGFELDPALTFGSLDDAALERAGDEHPRLGLADCQLTAAEAEPDLRFHEAIERYSKGLVGCRCRDHDGVPFRDAREIDRGP